MISYSAKAQEYNPVDSTFKIPYKGVVKAKSIYDENIKLREQISKYQQIEVLRADQPILSQHLLKQLEISNRLYENLNKEYDEMKIDIEEYERTLKMGSSVVDQLQKDLKKARFKSKVFSVGTLLGVAEAIAIYIIVRNK